MDGAPHREGVDLDPAELIEAMRAGATISTAAPAPGEFVVAYEHAAASGATAVLSIHVGAELSSTLASARLAATESRLPVVLVDSTTASFAVGCCVWAAAEALRTGAGLAEAAWAAEETATRVANVFVVSSLREARRSGRLEPSEEGGGAPVLTLRGGKMHTIGEATSDVEALQMMVSHVRTATVSEHDICVGVGDSGQAGVATELASALADLPSVREVVRYQVGPSVVAHVGPDSWGAVFARLPTGTDGRDGGTTGRRR